MLMLCTRQILLCIRQTRWFATPLNCLADCEAHWFADQQQQHSASQARQCVTVVTVYLAQQRPRVGGTGGHRRGQSWLHSPSPCWWQSSLGWLVSLL